MWIGVDLGRGRGVWKELDYKLRIYCRVLWEFKYSTRTRQKKQEQREYNKTMENVENKAENGKEVRQKDIAERSLGEQGKLSATEQTIRILHNIQR
jgi:uncharacterized LabA/DUF88 family protein